MQNDDEALLSVSLARNNQLVKMPIALEPHGIFSLNLCLLLHFKVVFGILNKVQ